MQQATGKPIVSFRVSRRRAAILLAALLLAAGSGCATVASKGYRMGYWTTLVVTRLRSPLYIRLPYGNDPLGSADYRALQAEIPPDADLADDELVADLDLLERIEASGKSEVTLRMVALSGGGARAASFSAFVLRDMEALYNAAGNRAGDDSAANANAPAGEDANFNAQAARPALLDAIDVFSTVSGGSIYAGYLGVLFSLNDEGKDYLSVEANRTLRGLEEEDRTRAFETLATKYVDSYAYLGGRAGCAYLSPANACLPPLVGLMTDADIVDLYAGALDTDFAFNAYVQLRFTHLERRPRFLFNTTNDDDNRPFILTQGRLHRGPHTGLKPAVNEAGDALFENPHILWNRGEASPFEEGRPFPYALTLEDINSDSASFPISYAVMGSAAFPVATEPMPMWHYLPVQEGNRLSFEKSSVVRVADGGLYENYGLTSAIEIYEYLRRKLEPAGVKVKLKLLAVDSANRVVSAEQEEGCFGIQSPIGYGCPVRGVVAGGTVIVNNYDEGQAVLRSIAEQRIRDIIQSGGSVDFTALNLADCSHYDAEGSEGVPTQYIISESERQILESCSAELVRGESNNRSFVAGD